MPPQGSYVHARLPNAGLGNKLFVWAKAHVFAHLNGLPLLVTGWNGVQIQPLLRGGDLRLYLNYFKRVDQVGWLGRLRKPPRRLAEPPVEPVSIQDGTRYEFSQVPPWQDYFADLKPHRAEVIRALLEMLTEARRAELRRQQPPAICLQIRMGDFRALQAGENFRSVGGVRTPLQYFIEAVQALRQVHGSELPVSIVSDGSAEQLQELLALPRVSLAGANSKIVDILLMAKSKILIPSAGSTFGYWGGFLGDNILLTHPDHTHGSIRPPTALAYEGPFAGDAAQWSPALVEQVRQIRV
jgi:hypothetical protein